MKDFEFDEGEQEEHSLYGRAIASLYADEKARWFSNMSRWLRWDASSRRRWIAHIEKEAALGLPMAEQVIARMIAIRMTK